MENLAKIRGYQKMLYLEISTIFSSVDTPEGNPVASAESWLDIEKILFISVGGTINNNKLRVKTQEDSLRTGK